MKNFKTLYIAILTLALISCNTLPPAKGLPFKYGNDCLPQAIVMCQALKEKGIDSDVLSIYTPRWGHSISIYMFPVGQNRLWAWDATWQSINLRAWRNDPNSIAKEWMKATRSADELTKAEFLK